MLKELLPNPFKKWPRNLPCFCGSGVKFKKCCHDKIIDVVTKVEHEDLVKDFNWMLDYMKTRREELAQATPQV